MPLPWQCWQTMGSIRLVMLAGVFGLQRFATRMSEVLGEYGTLAECGIAGLGRGLELGFGDLLALLDAEFLVQQSSMTGLDERFCHVSASCSCELLPTCSRPQDERSAPLVGLWA